MTPSPPGTPEPTAGTGRHPSAALLADYAAGAADGAAVWSVEAHSAACADCRAAVSAHADAARLARNRAVVLTMAALPGDGRAARLAQACGVPEQLLRLLTATPSLRRSWLLAVLAVLVAVTGEAALVHRLWPGGSAPPGSPWQPGAAALAPFLLAGPLVVLAGVAAAFAPGLDPSHRLAAAAPFPAVTLLLARCVSALVAALIPVVGAAFAVPGPGWLPAAVLLPSLAVCATALAAATTVGPVAAAVAAAGLWAVPVLWLTAARSSLAAVQGDGQALCAAVLVLAVLVVCVRRDRFETEWAR